LHIDLTQNLKKNYESFLVRNHIENPCNYKANEYLILKILKIKLLKKSFRSFNRFYGHHAGQIQIIAIAPPIIAATIYCPGRMKEPLLKINKTKPPIQPSGRYLGRILGIPLSSKC
jgi:hypothetical protein